MTTTVHASLPFADPRPEPKTPYDHALRAFLDDLFEAFPTFATQAGFHAHDDRWPDLSPAGLVRQARMLRRHGEALAAIPDGDLQEREAVDRGIASESIDSMLFGIEVLQEHAWDPLTGYVYPLGSGLFSLLAREFAPWQQRGTAALGRIQGIPAVLDTARTNLVGTTDGRPVSRLHTETALSQLSGVGELIDETLAEAARRATDPTAVLLRDALDSAAPAARGAPLKRSGRSSLMT